MKARKTATILSKRGPLSLSTEAEEAATMRRARVPMQATTARRPLPEVMTARPFTFADLFLDRSRFKHLKLPPWLFPIIYQRKDQASLTPCEQQRFLCALNVLIANGTYGKLVDVHAEMHMQHSNDRLLPWHRIFLLQLENALRLIHPDVSIPYWDWTQAGEESIPPWLATVTPTVTTPTRTIPVIRSPGTMAHLAMITSNVPTILGYTTWSPFANDINGVHGAVHMWVGGTMSDPSTSPADPIFWMHHANLDRLWWVWHTTPGNAGKNPPLSGADAVMDPWSYTEPDTRDIGTLGYTYA
jgi:tyrosinase